MKVGAHTVVSWGVCEERRLFTHGGDQGGLAVRGVVEAERLKQTLWRWISSGPL